MLRRVLAILALSAVFAALVGCGGDKNPKVKDTAKTIDNNEL